MKSNISQTRKTMNSDNASFYRASWSQDGSVGKSRVGEPMLTRDAAMAEAHRRMPVNKSVTLEYCDAGKYCAENKGKWFLDTIVK